MMKFTIEMLVDITPPSAAIKNLESNAFLVCLQAYVREIPNADYARKIRGILRILT